jgi:hypothetical protein
MFPPTFAPIFLIATFNAHYIGHKLNQNSSICSSTKVNSYQYVLFEILDAPKESLD